MARRTVWGSFLLVLSCGCGSSTASLKTADTRAQAPTIEQQLQSHIDRYRQVFSAEPENGEAQRTPLQSCLELKPQYPECEYLLGEVEERFENAQAAAEHFTSAARSDPSQLRYFRALSDIYQAVKQRPQAIMVLSDAVRHASMTRTDRAERAALLVTLARLSGEEKDAQQQRSWLEQVEAAFDDIPEKSLFELVLIYATLPTAELSEVGDQKTVMQLKARVDSLCAQSDLSKGSQKRCSSSSELLKERGIATDPPQAQQTSTSVTEQAAVSSESAASSRPVTLPAVHIERKALQVDGSYTVWGAGYLFRHPAHRDEVTTRAIFVRGHIIKSNVAQSIECSNSSKSKLKNKECANLAPTFWLCDQASDNEADCLRVMGFAAYSSALYASARALHCANASADPVPIVGATWRVRGEYGLFYGSSTKAAEMDATMGILAFEERDELEAAPNANQKTLLSGITCARGTSR